MLAALHRECKAGHHGCVLHLLTSNKLMIVFQGMSYGAIYAVAGRLTISCPSSETCTVLMNIYYWMGMRYIAI